VERTNPAVREEMVVEPLGEMVNKEEPVEEATTNKLSVDPETPWRVNRFWGVVVLIPTLL
jgi:hypothetical protein